MFHSAEPFTARQIAMIEGTAQNVAHSAVLDLLEKLVREKNITRAFIARRLGRDPAQITRWLGSPGNWTLQTLGLLMAAMGHLPTIGAQSVESLGRSNYYNESADLARKSPPKPTIEVKSDPSSKPTTIDLPKRLAA